MFNKANASLVPLTQARQTLGDLVNIATYEHQPVLLTRNNKPVAALVPLDEFEHLNKLEDAYWASRAQAALDEHKATGEPFTPAAQVWEELGI